MMSRLKTGIHHLLYRIVQGWRRSRLYSKIERGISRRAQERLRVDDFTILCSNCIGGTIYHRFGKQFKSPTVNLCFTQPDFVQFCLHLDYYLAQPLHFFDAKTTYPTAILKGNSSEIPDIRIDFNHYQDSHTAEEKWEDRKKRMDFDQLYVIFYNLDGITTDDIQKMDAFPCRNKVIFTATPLPEIDWSFHIEPKLSQQYPFAYLGKDLFGRRYYEKKFDVASFLNCDNVN